MKSCTTSPPTNAPEPPQLVAVLEGRREEIPILRLVMEESLDQLNGALNNQPTVLSRTPDVVERELSIGGRESLKVAVT